MNVFYDDYQQDEEEPEDNSDHSEVPEDFSDEEGASEGSPCKIDDVSQGGKMDEAPDVSEDSDERDIDVQTPGLPKHILKSDHRSRSKSLSQKASR